MKNYFDNEDFFSAIEERAFSAGYNARLNEKMYAEEDKKAAEGVLDKLKGYGNKAKNYGKEFWEGNNATKSKWGNRAIAGTTAVASVAIPTALYLRKKAKKAEEAAEALEEAAEAQREYSAYLANLEERIYSEDEDALEEAVDIVENASPADKKRLAIAGAIGAGSVAGIGGAAYGVSKGIQKAARKKNALVNASYGDEAFNKASKARDEFMKTRLKKTAGYLNEKEEALAKLWKSGNAGKAKVIGASAGTLALGASAGVGAKKAYDYYKNKKNND